VSNRYDEHWLVENNAKKQVKNEKAAQEEIERIEVELDKMLRLKESVEQEIRENEGGVSNAMPSCSHKK
jgi:hypothetical protein